MRAARLMLAIVALACSCGAFADEPAPAADPAAHVAPEVRALVQKFVDTVASLPGYQVTMSKQQRINGTLKPMETLLLKQTAKPDCRYMKWLADPHQGREAILCSDRYKGMMQVHESGILGITTLSIDPAGSIATSGNLRPITQAGIYNMAKTLKADIERRRASGAEYSPQVSERVIKNQDSMCLRSQGTGAGDKAPYPVGAVELCFYKTLAMPTEAQFWNRDGELMEHYLFSDWNLDPHLSDADFDTANKAYHF